MPNLIPQDIREWMRRMEFRVTDLTRRMSTLIPGDIADGVDLNGYKSTGRWRRASTVGTTTALNYPHNGAAGTLEVYWAPGNPQVHQIFYGRAGGMWIRWWNNVSWSPWSNGGLLDSGWVNGTLSSGTSPVSGHPFQVRSIGQIVYMRGRLERSSSSATQEWGTVPAQFLPDRVVEVPHRANSDATSAPGRVYVSPSSLNSQNTPTSNAQILINASYLLG